MKNLRIHDQRVRSKGDIMSDPDNLMEGLEVELKRAKELLKLYNSIPTGVFGVTMVKRSIAYAESSIRSGDTVEMIKAYGMLKRLE